MEKCGRAGQAKDNSIIRRMRAAIWISKAKTHPEHVIRIALSTTTMVKRRRLKVMLYVHLRVLYFIR